MRKLRLRALKKQGCLYTKQKSLMILKPGILGTTLCSLSPYDGEVRKQFHPRPELQRDHILSRQSLHYALYNMKRFYCTYHFKTKHEHAFPYCIEFVLQEINKSSQDPKWHDLSSIIWVSTISSVILKRDVFLIPIL